MPDTGKQFALNDFEVDTDGNLECGTVNDTTMDGNAIGDGASATTGGAVGDGATTTTGGAVGNSTTSSTGGAIGDTATATSGGAIGFAADVTSGGAIGITASATTGGAIGDTATATTGGAVGESAEATTGGALGTSAVSSADGAVQLGTGTNATTDTLQFLTYQLLDASGDIPAARLTNAARVVSVPASASATGTAGDIAFATGFLYICIASSTWERVVIATW